jgi:heme exporter protein C
MKKRNFTLLFAAAFVLMIFAIYTALIFAPEDKTMGIVQRIFYFHIAVAIVPYLAFLVVCIASILYLVRRERKWDQLAANSAEIGVIFDTLVLVTGPFWARVAWGVYWTWEPRLTTSLIVWLLYIAYLLLRRSVGEQEKRARFAAVFGVVAFVSVPINFMAIRWWRTIHPIVLKTTGMELSPKMRVAMFASLFAFMVLYILLLQLRIAIDNSQEELESLKDEIGS